VKPELKSTVLEDVRCQDSLYTSHLALAQKSEESMTKIQFNFFVQTNKQKMFLFVILPFFAFKRFDCIKYHIHLLLMPAGNSCLG